MFNAQRLVAECHGQSQQIAIETLRSYEVARVEVEVGEIQFGR
jgi:hypothetical protein